MDIQRNELGSNPNKLEREAVVPQTPSLDDFLLNCRWGVKASMLKV